MRVSALHVFTLVSILLANGCDRSTGPAWEYVCEGDSKNQCRAQLTDGDHRLTLAPEGDGWRMIVLREGQRYVRAELTANPPRREAIQLTARRKESTCWSNQCTFEMPQETVDALAKTKRFTITLKTVAISNQSVRHSDHTSEFQTRGLRAAMKKFNKS